MTDTVILEALRSRSRFENTYKAIPLEMLDPSTVELLHWYEVYFNIYTTHESIDLDALNALITLRYKSSTESRDLLLNLIGVLQGTKYPKDVLDNISNLLEELAFSGKLASMLMKYNSGEEIDITYEAQVLAQETRERMIVTEGKKWADGDILEYLEAEADDSGLQWTTFGVLEQTLKGLRPGNNVAVVAPTNKGKTSLLCRLAVDFAKQAKDLAEYKDSCILYLVNEGLAEAITPRLYCTALGLTRKDALAMAREGTLVPAYEAVVGKRDAIRLVNIHGMNISQVSRVIESHKPYIVITDMTGRIRSNGAKGQSNDVQELEDAWNSMRELSAVLHFAHIGTIQVSAEGMDTMYPPLTAMQWSKVGIQTTLDLCIMMGALNSPECFKLRGISTPKNKLARTGCSSENRFECYFEEELNTWDCGVLPA